VDGAQEHRSTGDVATQTRHLARERPPLAPPVAPLSSLPPVPPLPLASPSCLFALRECACMCMSECACMCMSECACMCILEEKKERIRLLLCIDICERVQERERVGVREMRDERVKEMCVFGTEREERERERERKCVCVQARKRTRERESERACVSLLVCVFMCACVRECVYERESRWVCTHRCGRMTARHTRARRHRCTTHTRHPFTKSTVLDGGTKWEALLDKQQEELEQQECERRGKNRQQGVGIRPHGQRVLK